MPFYEYQCRDCHQVFEVFQSMSDAPLNRCRHCGGNAERLMSPPAIVFKGSGFHVTDYSRSSGNGQPPKTDPASNGSAKEKTSGDNGKSLEAPKPGEGTKSA